jgi:hypothetical protein
MKITSEKSPELLITPQLGNWIDNISLLLILLFWWALVHVYFREAIDPF